MATTQEKWQEIANRGLQDQFDAPTRAKFDEAVSRGLITISQPSEEIQAEVSPVESQALISSQERSAIQLQLDTQAGLEQAASETGAGQAFLASAGRQFAKLGRVVEKGVALSALGRSAEGPGKSDIRENLADIETRRIEEARLFAPLKKQRPISTTLGELTGAVAVSAPLAAPVAGVVTKGASFLAPKLAPVLGFAAAGAIEEALLEGNPLLGAALGAGGGVLLPLLGRSLKQAAAKLTGRSADTFSELPEEIIIQLQQEGIDVKDLGLAAEEILRRNFDEALLPAGQARQARAGEFGAELTSAQATKDFAQQELEDLTKKSGTEQGRQVINILSEQQQNFIKGSEDKLLNPFGSTLTTDVANKFETFNKGEAGRIIRDSLKEIKTRDKKIISNLYKAAEEIPGEEIPLNGIDLAQTFLTRSDFSGVSDTTKNAMLKNLAKFGVIGKDAKVKGTGTIVNFQDDVLRFEGKMESLTIDNAEELRKRINAISVSNASDSSFKISMLDALDNSFGEAIEKIPQGETKKQAFETARATFSAWRDQFAVGDDITKILTFQDAKGNIPVIADEVVLDKFVNGANRTKNAKRLKEALLTNPTADSKQAWKDVQTVAMEDFLKKSMDRTTDSSGNIVNVFSGNRLTTNLEKMGSEQSKLLFGPEMTTVLNRFTQAVGDATIPVKGAINPSESGTRVANIMRNFLGQLGNIVRTGGGLRAEATRAIAKGRAEKAAIEQLEQGLRSVKGESLPKAQVEKTLIDWINSLGSASAKTAQSIQAPAITGATLSGTQQ